MREAVEIGDVRGEGGERFFDGLGVADVGEERVKTGKLARARGNRDAGLGHHGEQRDGLERDGFAAGVGAADDELAMLVGEFERQWDDRAIRLGAGGAEALFEQRVAGGFEVEPIGADGRGGAIVVAGEAGAGLQAVD